MFFFQSFTSPWLYHDDPDDLPRTAQPTVVETSQAHATLKSEAESTCFHTKVQLKHSFTREKHGKIVVTWWF